MTDSDDNSDARHARQLAAAEWVIRLHNTHADEDTMEQWLIWCQANAQNLETFENVRGLWSAFEHPAFKTSLISDLNVQAAPQSTPTHGSFPSALKSHFNGVAGLAEEFVARHRRAFSVLAVALSVSALGIGILHQIDASTEFTQTLSTAVGSLSRQTLPDGSVVELGAKSKVRVRMSHEQRTIFVDDGEAFFRVAKDSTRPFIVRAGELDVVALGTEFNVRKAEDGVVVTVEEGAVRVSPEARSVLAMMTDHQSVPQDEATNGIRAAAGRRVSYSSSKRSMVVTEFRATTSSPSDWAVGHLHFVNEPLASVIMDVNRYSQRHISLADDELGTLTFTGTLRRDAVDDWLEGIREVFAIDVLDEGDKGIVLSRRP